MVITPPALPGSPVGLLSQEQLQQLAVAQLASRKIRRAVAVATFDGWTLAIFAALSFVCGLSSISGILMGIGMGVVAWIELCGARQLRRLNAQAAKRLGFNQIALALLLILYAIGSLWSEWRGEGVMAALSAADPAAAGLLKPMEGLAHLLAMTVYGSLIGVAIVVQGGTAWFYFTRIKHIQGYLEQTPAWIIQMQKADISL
ncbi:MAG: hypothetical protein ACM359_23050 [Bacillota bacterium]